MKKITEKDMVKHLKSLEGIYLVNFYIHPFNKIEDTLIYDFDNYNSNVKGVSLDYEHWGIDINDDAETIIKKHATNHKRITRYGGKLSGVTIEDTKTGGIEDDVVIY